MRLAITRSPRDADATAADARRIAGRRASGRRPDALVGPAEMVMKCQKCAKPATFHITDIERGKPREYHFCDEHARQHLHPGRGGPRSRRR